MSILDTVKNLIGGNLDVEKMMKEAGDNFDISSVLGGLLEHGNVSLDTLGKTLLPVVGQVGGEEAKTETKNILGNLATAVSTNGIDEMAIVKGVINFLQKNNVSLDSILALLKKIPVDPADIIKFLGLLKK